MNVDEPSTIHELMAVAQSRISAIAKSEQGFNFQFRGVDTVVNAVRPVLAELGIVVRPSVGEPIIERYESGKGKMHQGVIVPVTFRFTGPAGDWVESTVLGASADTGDKAAVQAQSVALRVALLQTFLIPTDDVDPDSPEQHHERAAPGREPTADEVAAEAGWPDAARRQEAWDDLAAKAKLLPAAEADAIREWVKANKLRPVNLTTSDAEEWQTAIDEATADATKTADDETDRLKADESLDDGSGYG